MVNFRAFFLLILIVATAYSGCKKKPLLPLSFTPIPVDSFVGTYHVMGSWAEHIMGDTSVLPSGNIDTNFIISKGGDSTLWLSGEAFNYTTIIYTIDTIHNYNFVSIYFNGDNGAVVSFRRPYNDSIFFWSEYGGLGGGTATQWQG